MPTHTIGKRKVVMKNLIQKWNSINLIKRIICGLIVGIILGLAIPQASVISILGDCSSALSVELLRSWCSSW